MKFDQIFLIRTLKLNKMTINLFKNFKIFFSAKKTVTEMKH